jgi:hypothetical protein
MVLQRCLNKKRRRRITDISTIRFVVDEPMLSTVAAGVFIGPAASRRPVWRQVVPIVSAAIIASIATGVTTWTWRGGSSTSRAMDALSGSAGRRTVRDRECLSAWRTGVCDRAANARRT